MNDSGELRVCALAARLNAPRPAAFNFLADVENLPRWASSFCERLELSRGEWLALTIEGELFAEVEADERTGIVDLRLGDDRECTRLIALRVLALPAGQTVVSAVFHQAPGQGDFAFAQQCEAFGVALGALDEAIARRRPAASRFDLRVLAG